MKLPDGRLLRSRVVTDPRTVLVDALDRELTGYAVLEPRDALLLGGEGEGILTFRAGVPVVVYHTGTDRGGPPALADLAAAGPYQLDLYAADPGALDAVHERTAFRVPPGMPAERLAGDQRLADRTRAAGPTDRPAEADVGGRAGSERRNDDTAGTAGTATGGASVADAGGQAGDRDQMGAVEAFLADERKIEAIREQARAEAEARAEEWGFDELGSNS